MNYNRQAAVDYANRWWHESNPAFERLAVNCTNYVSQCLYAGHAAMHYTWRRNSGWWYRGYGAHHEELWSYSWTVAHALFVYLTRAGATSGLRARRMKHAHELQLGDLILFDWDGDARMNHSTIVTGFDAAGQPLVNANTGSSKARTWTSYPEAKHVALLHIEDKFGG